MDIVITPGPLRGMVRVPASKSASHRAVLCAALAHGTSVLSSLSPTQDIEATLGAVQALGAVALWSDQSLTVVGITHVPEQADIDCNESGSTLRFLVPIAAALGVPCRFFGRGQLPSRPMEPLVEQLQNHGVVAERRGEEILSIAGALQPGRYEIAGNISSQYITGLLFALPLLPGDSEIVLTSPLQSRGYVDMTLEMLDRYGVRVVESRNGYRVPGKQKYRPRDLAVEGDYSAAAFWLCAGAMGSDVRVSGLSPRSRQGDREIIPIISRFGGDVEVDGNTVRSTHKRLVGIDLDVSQIPDLAPIVAATASFANGMTNITGASRLRIKESDRLHTISAGLKALGAGVVEYADRLAIIGQDRLAGGCEVDSFGDHRIAMAMSIAALHCEAPVTIRGAECVDKSYPDFYKDLAALGGMYRVL